VLALARLTLKRKLRLKTSQTSHQWATGAICCADSASAFTAAQESILCCDVRHLLAWPKTAIATDRGSASGGIALSPKPSKGDDAVKKANLAELEVGQTKSDNLKKVRQRTDRLIQRQEVLKQLQEDGQVKEARQAHS
jgi:hypothetical protein